MVEGAPDYHHLRQIQGKDAAGNLVTVRVDSDGRIILLPYGTQTVAQDDSTRTIQGIEGETLRTILVDSSGRIIMVPYGTTTVNGTLNVDQNDKTRDIQGLDGETLRSIMVDSQGRLVMIPYGWDGSAYRKLLTDEDGRMVSAIKGAADVQWGLRGWWKFIASEDTKVKDYSGYANDGVGKSGASDEANYVDGIVGQAIHFDGSDDFITVSDADSLDITGDVTIECWIKREVTGSEFFHDRGQDGNDYTLTWRMSFNADDALQIQLGGGSPNFTTKTFGNITDTDWHHVVFTIEGTTLRCYVDGSQSGTDGTFSGTRQTCAQAMLIGKRTAGAEFQGDIDEFRIYSRALSLSEVQWRYEHTNPATGKPTRMVAVDSEGRMKVALDYQSFGGQVLIDLSGGPYGSGSASLGSAQVPPGKTWVITNAMAFLEAGTATSIDIGIYDGSNNYLLDVKASPAIQEAVRILSPAYFSAGDQLVAGFGGLGGNAMCRVFASGYILDTRLTGGE